VGGQGRARRDRIVKFPNADLSRLSSGISAFGVSGGRANKHCSCCHDRRGAGTDGCGVGFRPSSTTGSSRHAQATAKAKADTSSDPDGRTAVDIS